MHKIDTKIIADSISPQGHRIATMLVTFPRFILAELNTHRMFSRNSASSRAIPFEKMVKMVEEDPFIPIAWQKDHKGMQGNDYIQTDDGLYVVNKYWLEARDKAVKAAKDLHSCNITKQLCNRLLEPYMWHTTLVTATEFENFFELRCPKYIDFFSKDVYKSKKDAKKSAYSTFDGYVDKDWLYCNRSQAEIHMQALAESMWDAMNESTPKQLQAGEWHIPFGDKIVEDDLLPILYKINAPAGEMSFQKVKIATARCARLSYMTFDGEIDYEKDIKLHDQLLESKHYSPFEHCCRVMNDDEYETFVKGRLDRLGEFIEQYEEGYLENLFVPSQIQGWCNNVKGFIQYRYLIENGNS